MIKYALFVVLGIAAFSQIENYMIFNWLFILAAGLALSFNFRYINISSLLLIIMSLRLFEVLLWTAWDTSNNYIILPIYIVLDSTSLLLIYFRIPLLAKWEYFRRGKVQIDRYKITNADMILGIIYSAYLLLAILALVEHMLRHTEDFGLPASTWLYENARLVFNHYGYIKGTLNILEFATILATAHRFMHSNHFVRA